LTSWILGLSRGRGGAAALLEDGRLAAYATEAQCTGRFGERLSGGQPKRALRHCLDALGIQPEDLSVVAVTGGGLLDPIEDDVYLDRVLKLGHLGTPLIELSSHLALASLATSRVGHQEALVLVADAGGSSVSAEGGDPRLARGSQAEPLLECMSLYRAAEGSLELIERDLRPSPPDEPGTGLSRFECVADLVGNVAKLIFPSHPDGRKVMELAAYGQPAIPVDSFFEVDASRTLRFKDEVPSRFSTNFLNDRWDDEQAADLCASVQRATEVALLGLAERCQEHPPCDRLLYTGALSRNTKAGERLRAESGFDEVVINPVTSATGAAIGAALHAHRSGALARASGTRSLPEAATPPSPRERADGVPVALLEHVGGEQALVESLCSEQVVGVFRGIADVDTPPFTTSILLWDPRIADGRERFMEDVCLHEPFRPPKALCLADAVSEWFEAGTDVVSGQERYLQVRTDRADDIPSVVHLDGKSVVVALDGAASSPLARVVAAYRERSGVPMLAMTELEVGGIPEAATLTDAAWSFLLNPVDAFVAAGRSYRKHARFSTKRLRVGLAPGCLVRTTVTRKGHVEPALGYSEFENATGLRLRLSALEEDFLEHIDGKVGLAELVDKWSANRGLAEIMGLLARLRRAEVIVLSAPKDVSA